MFHDEAEFHSQLIKLIGVAKIPLILTMSALPPQIDESFMSPLRELEVPFDVVKYKYMQLRPKEIVYLLKIISVFE